MKVILIINSLGAGGAERVMSNMANYFTAKGWEVIFITFDNGSTPPFYRLDTKVDLIPLDIAKKSQNFLNGCINTFNRIEVLRSKIISIQPDAVISFMSAPNVLSLLACIGLNIPVVISERNDPELQLLDLPWSQLRYWTYPLASALVVQNQKIGQYFSNLQPSKIHIIPNPVIVPKIKQSFANPNSHHSLIAVGRLVPQKGFDLLLQAFSKIVKKYPDWKLNIIGEGELRQQLELLRDRLEISGNVFFPGLSKNIYNLLNQTDIFVLSSRYEGFPNALCEAMACGLPVIATNVPSASVGEIVRHEVDGLLVPTEDVNALADAMERLISNESERLDFGKQASSITSRFNENTIMQHWVDLINKVISDKGVRSREKLKACGESNNCNKFVLASKNISDDA